MISSSATSRPHSSGLTDEQSDPRHARKVAAFRKITLKTGRWSSRNSHRLRFFLLPPLCGQADAHLLCASPCGQQTAKSPRPRKSRDGVSIPGPARHFWEAIRAGVWPGSCHLSLECIISRCPFTRPNLPIAGPMMKISSGEQTSSLEREGLRRLVPSF